MAAHPAGATVRNHGMDRKPRYTKATLPTKTCATCGRPFAWRKKWAQVWDEVKYCSERCRGERRQPKATST